MIGVISIFVVSAISGYMLTGAQPHWSAAARYTVELMLELDGLGLLLAGAVTWRRGRSGGVEAGKNYILLVVTSLLLLLAVEGGLRLLLSDVTTTADNSSYFAQKWLAQMRFNHLGFREREFSADKPAGVYRIAFVGDSLTFGQGIDEEARFSNRVGHQLNATARNSHFETLNFGKPGAETVDELQILQHQVLPAHPDFVLLQWYINDPQDHRQGGAQRPLPLFPALLTRNTALFYLINLQFAQLQRRLHWIQPFTDFMLQHYQDPASPESQAADQALREFIALCRQQGIGVGMAVFSESYFDKDTLDFLADRVLNTCRQDGIPCIDARPLLEPYKNDMILRASRLDPHPSAFANQLVAEAMLRTFGPLWTTGGRTTTGTAGRTTATH